MTDPSQSPPRRRLVRAVLRDPLTHFLIGGAILFAAFAAGAPERVAAPADPLRIEITEDDLRQIALVVVAQGRVIPTAEQLRDLAQQEAVERVLVREALSLGLDQNDEIINRRLAQKMDFLLADLAALDAPSDEVLRAWYDRNAARFAVQPRANFRHLFFSTDKRGGEGARAAAADLLARLGNTGPADPDLAGLADPFMFRDYYGGKNPMEVTKEFGPDFAAELYAQQPGRWAGPIRSGYGWHLVWIDSMEAGHIADLDSVREAVLSAWHEERYQEIRKRAYDEMLSRYSIVMPDAASVAGLLSEETASSRNGTTSLVMQ
ncbi:peptidyl-prolyl cis-trans isomerase [Paracoccus marinaquae]|uniref:peptidylprolyl isomerase n=1 Tax=Paracoccus marinaquae TaxID=2841926 RepID=A0ABS6AJD6_9RHOB|nr:peptidylprolyl isomerase [Paracoccus marinaquae]MBU3030698.1 peptidyl-prolyl cis-trans isomerase [Paracoccus marinaquae]